MPKFDIIVRGYVAICPPESKRFFSAEVSKFSYSRQHKKKIMKFSSDPFYLQLSDGRIAVGLGALKALKAINPLFDYNVVSYLRDIKFSPLDYFHIEGIDNRDYQEECLKICRLEEGGVIELPTSAGKTEIEIKLTSAASRQHNCIFMAPSDVTINNFLKRCEKYNIESYGVKISHYRDFRDLDREFETSGNIIVTHPVNIYNDLKKRGVPEIMNTVGSLFTDEGHHLSAKTWQSVLYTLNNLVRSIALSATAVHRHSRSFITFNSIPMEDALVYNASGNILYSVEAKDIKEYIDSPDVINYEFEWDESHWKDKLLEDSWTKIVKHINLNYNRIRTISSIMKCLSSIKRSSITSVSRKELGKKILLEAGLKDSVCWYGGGVIFDIYDNKYKESELREKIDSGDINHLIITSHADEGLDLPDLSTLILTEGKSYRSQKQKAGRISRKGNLKSIVININDTNFSILSRQATTRSFEITNYHSTQAHKVSCIEELKTLINRLEKNSVSKQDI